MRSTLLQAEQLRIAGELCKTQFHDLLEASRRQNGHVLNVLVERRILNHSQRFGIWTANVDILETGPHSLDFRLNQKRILRDYTMGVLNEINVQLSRGKPHDRYPFEPRRFNSFAVIKIATNPQTAITSELYVEASDSSPDIVAEDANTRVASEEEICDEIIQERLNSLFEIASELLSGNTLANTEQPREAIRNIQHYYLTLGAETSDFSTTGSTYWTLNDSTTLPEHSVKEDRNSKGDFSSRRQVITSNKV